ncbi:MAG: response regulator [Armatimonadota bacterium]
MAKRIMIVDDSMYTRLELRNLLLSHGYAVAGEASNGRAAVEMYDRIKPDLTIVDAQMPDMDGVCTIRQIHLLDPNALLLVCASSGERGIAMEAMSAGAVDLCVKPFVERAVTSTIRRALAGIVR